eukprot:GHVU01149302.1.p1 GENE.GHVU01149302.1~~GHVU01149302.1.p1  ORF type:complete len:310 (-),score=44.02 GHVU01149302.1:538-1467(-)
MSVSPTKAAALVGKYPVYLRVYDISDGAAAFWSPLVLWRKIEGVWHTGIHAYGYEYFYGGGILKMYPQDVEECFSMKPKEVVHLGYTAEAQVDFERFLDAIGEEFSRESYDLLTWNCNNFSDECAKFLLDKGIPERILGLPGEVGKTPMGGIILRAMRGMRGKPAIDSKDVENRTERLASVSRSRRGSVASNASSRHMSPPAALGGREKPRLPHNALPAPRERPERPRRYSCPGVPGIMPVPPQQQQQQHNGYSNAAPPGHRPIGAAAAQSGELAETLPLPVIPNPVRHNARKGSVPSAPRRPVDVNVY